MKISITALACALGLAFASCTAEVSNSGGSTPVAKKDTPPAKSAALTTQALELDKVP